ncbi:MAG: hypothetical protein LAT57_06640, partial [Balneolales bacterium]|nr:hypothetical protein [Balneolales bacterium]
MRLFWLLLILLFLPIYAISQPVSIGVHWEIPAQESEQIADLKSFNDLALSIILVDGETDQRVLEQIPQYTSQLWLSSGIDFIREFDVRENSDSLQTVILGHIGRIPQQTLQIQRYVISGHPQRNATVASFITDIADRFQYESVPPLYIITTPGSADDFDATNTSQIIAVDGLNDVSVFPEGGTMYIIPPTLDSSPARNLRSVLDFARSNDIKVILPSEYLDNLIAIDPNVAPVILEYASSAQPVIALPADFSPPLSINYSVILLVGNWIILLIFFSINGAYNRSVTRYIFTHNFFVNDVMSRRLKAGNDIAISILITTLFSGLMTMILASAIANTLVIEMLNLHAPFLAQALFSSEVSAMMTGVVFVLGVQLIGLVWLRVASLGSVGAGQILHLMLIPMHIVVLVGTVMAILNLNDYHGNIHLIL